MKSHFDASQGDLALQEVPIRTYPGLAWDVLEKLYNDYMGSKGLFASIQRQDAPQNLFIPEGMKQGSPEHALWLFFATMTDRRDVSDNVYRAHVKLHKETPWLYTEEVIGKDPQEFEPTLKAAGVSMSGASSRVWPVCAKTLFEVFDGNPLALYAEGSIDGILKWKARRPEVNLPGFGPKILSLLSLFYEELGLVTMPKDAFPVDVHVQRFCIATGIIEAQGKIHTQNVEKALRPLLCRIVNQRGWSALELSHAIWLLGNRQCTGCHRNGESQLLCPVYRECGGPPNTRPYFKKGAWDFDSPRLRKGGEKTFRIPDDWPLFGTKTADAQ